MEEKRCRLCGEWKPLSEYYRARGTRDGHRTECRDCNLEQRAERYRTTLEFQENYDRMLEEQAGGCAICGRPPRDDISLHVDHDHDTGLVRGLLCFRCNGGLGQFGEDPGLLRAAAKYLELTGASPAARPRRPPWQPRLF